MAKGIRAMVIAAVSAAAIVGQADAGSPAVPRVVLHVTDHASVPADMLGRATRDASRVYERAGVAVEWTDGWAALAPNDGALHLDVVFLAEHMPAYQTSAPTTFGRASAVSRRAYIFVARAVEYARVTFSDPSRVLAIVLAHEVGHMLMPDARHTRGGLMRADWSGRLFDVPALSRSEGVSIRSRLMASR